MASIILVLLGIVEVFAGSIVYFHYFPIFSIFLWLGVIYALKGVWSMVSSVAAGYYYDWMGALDFIVGITLLLIFYGTIFPFIWIIGVAQIFKGLYTIVSSI